MRPSASAAALAALILAACSSDEAPEHPGAGGSVSAPDADAGDVTDITWTTIEARGFSFDARVAGPESGDVVFLLHGFPETSFEWRFLMPALARAGYRAVAPDQRGYSPGARPEGVEAYTVVELVADVAAMADAIGADTFHVVGHDWGAAIAWGIAALAPDRVLTVTPMSVPHPEAFREVLSDPTSCQYSASAYFDTFSQPGYENEMLADDALILRVVLAGAGDDAVAEYLRVLGTPEALGAALNWYRANVANRNLSATEVPSVTVPTTFIWSDGDVALCRDGADLTEQYVTGPYVFEVVPGVSHWIPEEAPDRVEAAVLARVTGAN